MIDTYNPVTILVFQRVDCLLSANFVSHQDHHLIRLPLLEYCSVSHVEVIGGRLFPGFDIEILEPSGKIVLKYFPNPSPIRIRHHRAQPFLIPRLPLLRGGLMQGPLRAFGRMPHLFQRIRQQDESDDPGSQQHEPEPT